MNRAEAWFVHVSNLLVGGTGIVYAWMRYALEPADPYAVVHHPLQPMVQHLHLWTAPLLVFAAGLIWRDHVWKHFRRGVPSGRRSGISLLLTLIPMIVSGYLIQTAVTPAWRTAWIAIHLATSGLWLLGYSAHYVAELKRRARKRQALEGTAALRSRVALDEIAG